MVHKLCSKTKRGGEVIEGKETAVEGTEIDNQLQRKMNVLDEVIRFKGNRRRQSILKVTTREWRQQLTLRC